MCGDKNEHADKSFIALGVIVLAILALMEGLYKLASSV